MSKGYIRHDAVKLALNAVVMKCCSPEFHSRPKAQEVLDLLKQLREYLAAVFMLTCILVGYNENLMGIGTATKTLSVIPLMLTENAHIEDILCTSRKLHIEKASFMFKHTVAEMPKQS